MHNVQLITIRGFFFCGGGEREGQIKLSLKKETTADYGMGL